MELLDGMAMLGQVPDGTEPVDSPPGRVRPRVAATMGLGTRSTTDAHLLPPLPARRQEPPIPHSAVDTGARTKSGKRILMDQNGNYFIPKADPGFEHLEVTAPGFIWPNGGVLDLSKVR